MVALVLVAMPILPLGPAAVPKSSAAHCDGDEGNGQAEKAVEGAAGSIWIAQCW
jgi:hypothetical protein